jgi:outer membrane protein assembly factor BamB
MTAPTPLVLALRSTLVALDPETGVHRWRASFAMQIRRVFPVEGAVLVVLAEPGVRGAVHAVDLATGMTRAGVELGFDPSGATLVKDGRLFVASEHGVACVTTDCRLVWKGAIQGVPRGLFGLTQTLVITGADGTERAQLEVGAESSSGNAGLVLGDLASQPDLRD